MRWSTVCRHSAFRVTDALLSHPSADVFREIDAPADWWVPIRKRLMLSLDIEEVVGKEKAVVVYISRCVNPPFRLCYRPLPPDCFGTCNLGRQVASSRRLTPEAHSQLVASLSDMDAIELHVPQMERMSPREQMRLVSKADILIGVHGNGLTNELWLRPGGAVIESAHSRRLCSKLCPSMLTRPDLPCHSPVMDAGGFTKDYQVVRPDLFPFGFASPGGATGRRPRLIALPSCL